MERRAGDAGVRGKKESSWSCGDARENLGKGSKRRVEEWGKETKRVVLAVEERGRLSSRAKKEQKN